MPIVTVKLLEGRTDDQLKNLVQEITNAVEKTTDAKRDAISVVIEEMKPNHFGVGGTRKSDQ
ncbi:2-hydroxymuconate tautomerase [Staphylococcus sp. 17KM0847]|uniref:2-hydroxymuconate tautomerase n=1 Tax=Staphylococcus sp. 17KM0847 TaxID=2583989 RepID=UPI0015DBE02A|nr:2-hydroxymuconate tautomerase [Staphylococcus sp. 17KM0847]QLK86215.1 4-oxalocrotonate tautomerase [Staphylococcus sp. 17KM0847]